MVIYLLFKMLKSLKVLKNLCLPDVYQERVCVFIYLLFLYSWTCSPARFCSPSAASLYKALSAAADVSVPSLHIVYYQHIMQPLLPSTAVVPSPFPLSCLEILQQRNGAKVNLQPHPASFYQVYR